MHAIKKFTSYLRDSKEEIRKITWPSRRDTIKYSSLVLGITVVTALVFGGLDIVFSRLLAWLIA